MENTVKNVNSVPQVLPEKKATEPQKNEVDINALYSQINALKSENQKLTELAREKDESNQEKEPQHSETAAQINELIAQRDHYKALAVEKIKENILSDIKSEFPDVKIKSVDELPKEFHTLICAHVPPALAYRVVTESEKAKKDKRPASMGEVNCASEKEKEFYSSADVDKLSKKQLANPKVMNAVMKSMLKW